MPIAETPEYALVSEAWQEHTAAAPVPPPWRVLKAYRVTFLVLASYLWLRFLTRFRSKAVIGRKEEQAHVRNARRIYRAIVELQGLYIKVGQLFSCMANFLPAAFRRELDGLQDRVPPRPYEAIEQRIRDEFDGRGPQQLFRSFDPTPIASASIGQVHMARTLDGHRVAVKVQYPDIETTVRADLQALRTIFSVVERFIPYRGMDSIHREIRSIILQELDYTAEAGNSAQVGAAFGERTDVHVPRVIPELSTKHILTTEFIDGVKVNDTEGLAALGIDPSSLARLVIEAYCQQIFRQGVYHADPHPGNILVSAGPTIHFIDFGAVAEISSDMRHGLVELLQGALNRDTQRITSALHKMGFIAHRADPAVYDRVIEYFHSRIQAELKLDSFNLKDIRIDPQRGFENLADLRQMDISLADITDTFHVPKDWIMLERTVLMLTGLCTELDPNLNPMEVIRPHLQQFVLGKDGDWSRFMLDTGRDVALSVVALPSEIRKFTTRALQGELSVRLVSKVDSLPIYYALGHQLIYTALGITSGIFALHFHEQAKAEWAHHFTVATGLLGLLLLHSMWRTRRWIRRRQPPPQ